MRVALFLLFSIVLAALCWSLIILNRRVVAKLRRGRRTQVIPSFVDEVSSFGLEEDETVPEARKKTKFVVPFFERFPSKVGASYRPFWILSAEYFFALHFLAVYLFNETRSLIPTIFVVSLLNSFTPIAHAKSSEMLARFYTPISKVVRYERRDFRKWFKKQMTILYYSKENLACSLAGAILFVISTYFILNFPYQSVAANVTLYINAMLVGLMGGPLYRFIIMSAIFVLKLSRFPMRIYIHNHPTASVKLIGRLLLNFALFYAAPAYSLCVIIAILVHPIALTQMIWIVAGAAIVLLYFFVPQWGLHKAMYTRKQNLMHKVSLAADRAIHDWESNPVPATLAEFTKLCDLQERIAKMEEWPFNAGWLAPLLTSLIIPMLLAVLQLAFNLVLKRP